IHLEVCPTCNVQINLFQTHADHPIQQLYEAGLSVGINTDSRAMTPVTLSEEYHKLQQTFGWNSEQFLRCNRNALAAAFIPETEKNLLRQRLESGYMEFR
ncbi:MAG: adenosine deaminase, partial [Calditrichaeota bacterium]|nr:adenosine deaminase [Calditrichota bacterium]